MLRNRTALLLAMAAAVSLGFGFLLPMFTVASIQGQEEYSLLSSIRLLFVDGDMPHMLLGGFLFLFSMVFPVAKIVLIVLLGLEGTPVSVPARTALRRLLSHLGKISMIDVFTLAILVVIFKMNELVDIRAGNGVLCFALAILLSLAASIMLSPGELTDAPRRGSMGRGVFAGFALAVLLMSAGGSIWFFSVPSIDTVSLSRSPGKGSVLMDEILSVLDTTDYYLVIKTSDRGEIRTGAREDVPIGNRLSWTIDPIPLDRIVSVTVYDLNEFGRQLGLLLYGDDRADRDVLPDEPLDRMSVSGTVARGRFYVVVFSGQPSRSDVAGQAAVGMGASLLLVVVFALLGGPRWRLAAGLAVLAIAGGLALVQGDATVNSIRVAKKAHAVDASDFLGRSATGDYYVLLTLESGARVATTLHEEAVMGDGLAWAFPPTPLSSIREAVLYDRSGIAAAAEDLVRSLREREEEGGGLWDVLGPEAESWWNENMDWDIEASLREGMEGLVGLLEQVDVEAVVDDSALDRVEVTGSVVKGERYVFSFHGPLGWRRVAMALCLAFGGFLVLRAVFTLLWRGAMGAERQD